MLIHQKKCFHKQILLFLELFIQNSLNPCPLLILKIELLLDNSLDKVKVLYSWVVSNKLLIVLIRLLEQLDAYVRYHSVRLHLDILDHVDILQQLGWVVFIDALCKLYLVVKVLETFNLEYYVVLEVFVI